ncbi:MAG: RsmB/NOP family class I SAM-dependent RNA methyltransferase [Chloroflexota bacterium]
MSNDQPPTTEPQSPFSRYRDIIPDWEQFQEVIKRPLATTIWANPLKTTPEALSAKLTAANVPHEPISWYPGGFRLPANFKPGLRWEYLAGLYQVQEEIALLPVLMMNIEADDRVLDMCAAPGNKTAQLSVALNNKGTVVANDRNVGRMRAASQTLNRLGLLNITTTTVDAANYSKHAGQFDKVLADVPCTCEGTCRRDKSLLIKPVKAGKLVGTQKAILRKAVHLCRPGGQIIYATCTFSPEENECVVDAILQEFGDQLHIVEANVPADLTTSSGLTKWQDQQLDPSLQKTSRIWPHQNDTGGFFVAVLEKSMSEQAIERHGDTANPSSPPRFSPPRPLAFDEEREPWLTILEDRFGIPKTTFDEYAIYRVGKKKIYIVNREQMLLVKPQADQVGMHFMRVEGKYPKLTTGAAMIFGPFAQRNVLTLTPEQAKAFYLREEFPINDTQASQLNGNGYVMLRYQDAFIGQGTFYIDGQRIASLFPKAWSRPNLVV